MKRITLTSSIGIILLAIGCQPDEVDDGDGDGDGGATSNTTDTDDIVATGGTKPFCSEGKKGCACKGGDTCFDALSCSKGLCVPDDTSMGGHTGATTGNAGAENEGGSDSGSGGEASRDYCEHASCVAVPPTNQVSCYNQSETVSCPDFPCQVDDSAEFCGQDGQYPSEARTFTCYDAAGDRTACSDVMVEGETVVDSLTDLRWQRSYNIDLTQDEAVEYCEGLNASNYGTFDDWRLPEIHELLGMFDYGGTKRSFDLIAFPDTSQRAFWSATVDVEDQMTLYRVSSPDQWAEANDQPLRARCVRGPMSAWPMEEGVQAVGFPGKKSILDRTTGLVWSQPSSQEMNWSDALDYCEGLDRAGHDNWRLPTIQQLLSAVEYHDWNLDHPFLTSRMWSSTTDPTDPSSAWSSSSFGWVSSWEKTKERKVSCVLASLD